jgi:hypothetical protein
VRLSRDEQDVVERQPFARELAVELDEAFQLRLVEIQTLHPPRIPRGPDGSTNLPACRSAGSDEHASKARVL